MAETDMTGTGLRVAAQALDLSPERVFARRMKRERLRRGLRQEDLAEQLLPRGLDLHPSAIAKIEREPDSDRGIEPRMIRLNEARVIASVFNMGVDRMLSDDDLKNPQREIDQLEEQLRMATESHYRARTEMIHAEHRLAELHSRVESARSAVVATKSLDPDSIFAGLRFSKDFRDSAEAFIAYWFRVDRHSLIERGWGADNRGEPNDPKQMLGQAMIIAQVFPDLAQISSELEAKLRDDMNWWTKTGMRLHDQHIRKLVAEKMFRDPSEAPSDRPSELPTAREKPTRRKRQPSLSDVERAAEKLGVSSPKSKPSPDVSQGDHIEHSRYGLGRVLDVEGQGARQQICVDFGGSKMWIVARHAPIVRVEPSGPDGNTDSV